MRARPLSSTMVVAFTILWGACGAREPASAGADAGTGGSPGETGGATASGGATGTGGSPGGSGGSSSTGGSPGAGGNGGAAVLPPCLRDLFAACPATGMCNAAGSTDARRYCFANGVSANSASSGGCTGNGRILVEVRMADGRPCYSAELRPGPICEGESITWSDAAGHLIASGSWAGGSTTTIQCATGETGTCTGTQCTLGSIWPPDSCLTGTCPAAP